MAVLMTVKLVLVLSLFAAKGFAIKCYICNSSTDKDCWQPSSQLLKECGTLPNGTHYTMCRKTDQKVPEKSLGDTAPRVIRSCGYEPSKMECILKAGMGAEQKICTCDTDGCNGGSALQLTLSTLASVCLLGLVLPKIIS